MTTGEAGPAAKAPEVSVVVGIRDGAARLEPALRSILAQRDADLELVVVDDGSSDRTPEILRALAGEDARVRVFRQQPLGLTAALIRGCEEARGRFIARQDADEVSSPERLHRQLAAFAAHPELVLASCWTRHVAPRGELLRIETGSCDADRLLPIFLGGRGSAEIRIVGGATQHGSAMFPAALYRKVGGYRAHFGAAQDWDLWLRLGEHGPCLIVGDVLLTTTLDAASLSFSVRDLQLALGELATEALRRRLDGKSETDVLARAAHLSTTLLGARNGRRRPRAEALGMYHIGEHLRRRHDRASLFYFRRALKRDPFLLRAWIRSGQAFFTIRRSVSAGPAA